MDIKNLFSFTMGIITASAIFYLIHGTPKKDHIQRIANETRVKTCNRVGAIYADGFCQHVFAPVCRIRQP